MKKLDGETRDVTTPNRTGQRAPLVGPWGYGVVVARSELPPTEAKITIGESVRITKKGRTFGQTGTVRSQIADDGEVMVELEGGDKGYYRAVPPSPEIEMLEELTVYTATVVTDGKFLEVGVDNQADPQPGDQVLLSLATMQIVRVTDTELNGPIAFFRRRIDEQFSEVDTESSIRIVFNGTKDLSPEKGDRIMLDLSGSVMMRNLGKEDERFSFFENTDVTWDQIGGLEEAKRQMIEAVELPSRNPEIYTTYKKKRIKGVLLYGPAGCGKTKLGKATATAIAALYEGKHAPSGFLYIKGPEILDKYVGVAEATVRSIFARARVHREEHGYPAVIFIDEADAILGKRGSGVSSDMERTIVPMFLSEMDGLDESGAFVLLATNRPDTLDPAIVRDGRIDRKIRISRPTRESATEIFAMNLAGMPLKDGNTVDDLAEHAVKELFSPTRVIYRITTAHNGIHKLTLGQIVNGGMIEGIIDQATSLAIYRDLAQGGNPGGLGKEELDEAIAAVQRQNQDINHDDALAEFVRDFQDDVTGVQRLSQTHH